MRITLTQYIAYCEAERNLNIERTRLISEYKRDYIGLICRDEPINLEDKMSRIWEINEQLEMLEDMLNFDNLENSEPEKKLVPPCVKLLPRFSRN